MPKQELTFSTPLMNAAGTLGFTPDARGPLDLSHLGVFVTNPVSLPPRKPAHVERYLAFPGGFLIHTGLPNPGLSQVIRRYAGRWARSELPVVVHLIAQEPGELTVMVERLETLEGVMGIEVGLPPEAGLDMASGLVSAAVGELPIIVRLPLDRCVEYLPVVKGAGLSSVSLGPPRGALPGDSGEVVTGRLYGPSLFPLALRGVRLFAQEGIPVIGSGGIYGVEGFEAMRAAGAVAVQLDAVLWRWDLDWAKQIV